ncbi:MAG: hypothetical protein JST30_16560 [Armatimonadetes bacterium]|nr:hypothetical protein [Armatimonadota bacterium]
MATRFEWPTVLQTTEYVLVGSRVFEPLIKERKDANRDVWSRPSSWRFGFYFGTGDTRLWVPRRRADGSAHDDERVINFRHPLGKKAFRILMFGYGTALSTLGLIVLALFGVRW